MNLGEQDRGFAARNFSINPTLFPGTVFETQLTLPAAAPIDGHRMTNETPLPNQRVELNCAWVDEQPFQVTLKSQQGAMDVSHDTAFLRLQTLMGLPRRASNS